MPPSPLVSAIRARLRDRADPSRAPQMQAYMKSAMPCLGVRVPEVRAIVRAEARARPPASLRDLVDDATALWRRAEFREERYAATGLTGLPLALGRLELLDLHREMIVTGAWWDHVDEVAHRVGATLRSHPEPVAALVRAWSTDADLWLRRAALVCQVGLKRSTDTALLRDVVVANLDDPDFFIRKAVGWALRDYARTDPDWVRELARELDDRLSPLSRREALKHL